MAYMCVPEKSCTKSTRTQGENELGADHLKPMQLCDQSTNENWNNPFIHFGIVSKDFTILKK